MRATFGHYEVLGPIGAGGMGEVYVAHDPRLGRKVAIKMLPQRLAAQRETLSRFTQEARSASALNHPNIVTIYEVGTEDGSPYIVMELIDGTDVRSIVSAGAAPMRRVLDIGAQIADGLAAAHERGIVHRDLKPENIMITRDGFVKILDFGLAKLIGPAAEGQDTVLLDHPATHPGTILGTVGYMSPEQATGRRLDFRSDQFALGAILYELATGKAAFEGENAIDTLSAILHHDPPPVTRVNAKAPVQLADVISRLLSKSPDDRYASTRDLARELRLVRDRVVAEESGFHPRPSHDARPSLFVATAAGIALAVFIAGAVLLTRDREPPRAGGGKTTAALPSKQYLAVVGFKDLTGDPNGQLVVDGFAETLTARLAHYPMIQVMRPPPTAAAATPDAGKIARDLGANLVLSGSMMRDGERLRVTYSVVEPRSGREWRDLVEGNVTDLFGVQDEVAASVADNLSLGAPPARASLDHAVSQRKFLEAVGHMRRYDSAESIDSAIGILEDLGPSPSVQAALARAYLYKFQNTHQPQLAAAAGRAADRALEADPQSIDVNVTIGELRRQTGRYQEAVASFLRVLSQQPNNADAVLGLAETYKAAGDLENAEASYKRAIGLQPNFWGGYNKLGAFYYVQGRYEDAIPQFRKVTQLVPDNQRGYNNLGGTYQRLGRYEDAVRVFSVSIKRAPSGQAWSNLGTSHYFVGRYAEAAQAFEKAVELSPHDYLYWRNLGDAYRWIPGEEANARRAFERAIDMTTDAIRVNPSDARAYTSRATSLAKLGRQREARAAIIRALELEPRYAPHAYEAAVIANIGGDVDETTSRIEQALRLGQNAGDFMRDPEFANLERSGRLQAIITGFRSRP
jgi:serine/threonine-protein kinase